MKAIIKRTFIYLLAFCMLYTAGPSASAKTSSASVKINPSNGPTRPVDPDTLADDLTKDEVYGDLAILLVSDFNFGVIDVSTVAETYDIYSERPNIQIVDLRGTGKGWSVTATLSEFTDGTEAITLEGSEIYIRNGRPNSKVSMEYAPTPVNATLSSDNEDIKIIDAPINTGMGLWVMRWYPENTQDDAYVQLYIPAGVARMGTHTATITWTLVNSVT